MPHSGLAETAQDAAARALEFANGNRAHAYQRLFHDGDGEISHFGEKVLADLNKFCRGNKTTFHPDARAHALAEGRREVLLRILNFLNVDSAEIAKFVEIIDE